MRFLMIFFSFFAFQTFAFGTNFSTFYDIKSDSLKPFALDIGGLLGSGANHTARSLGFSGFDLGYKEIVQLKPSAGNGVFKSKRALNFGWVQAEIGMPYRIDGFIKAGNYNGMTIAGGGLRYGIRRISDEVGYWQCMIEAMTNMAVHKYFYATHFSSMLYLSKNGKKASPYIGAGFDNTKLVVNKAADASLIGKKVYALEERFVLGTEFKFRFFYFSLDANYTHDRLGFLGGAGMRF